MLGEEVSEVTPDIVAKVTGAKKPIHPPRREPKGMLDEGEQNDNEVDFVEILSRL